MGIDSGPDGGDGQAAGKQQNKVIRTHTETVAQTACSPQGGAGACETAIAAVA
jgi:hypothetical protein